MKIKYKLLKAEFIDRPNRFLTRVKYNNEIVESHLPDPGRLQELLIPGAQLLIKREYGNNRKTKFSTQAVYVNNILISLNTLMPNLYTAHLLQNKEIEFLREWTISKREVNYGNHRFDFQLINGDELMILEVKSVTLVENKIAKFPDAVTLRGRKHVQQLGDMAKKGMKTMVLFVVQRHDSIMFKPQWERDPGFGSALFGAWRKGLNVRVIHMEMTPYELNYLGELKYALNPDA